MKTIEELQEEMNRFASQLNALPKYKAIVLIPTETTPSSGPWYEVGDGEYLEHYTGKTTYPRPTEIIKDDNEFLFQRTSHLIFSMAVDLTLGRRQSDVDYRRRCFTKELELFGLIDREWQKRVAKYIKATFDRAPYIDDKDCILLISHCQQIIDGDTNI